MWLLQFTSHKPKKNNRFYSEKRTNSSKTLSGLPKKYLESVGYLLQNLNIDSNEGTRDTEEHKNNVEMSGEVSFVSDTTSTDSPRDGTGSNSNSNTGNAPTKKTPSGKTRRSSNQNSLISPVGTNDDNGDKPPDENNRQITLKRR